MLEHGFASVTVEDITERADLSRATFYGHYTDRDALLDSVVTELIEEMQRRLQPLVANSVQGFTGKPVLELFRHAAEERDAYRVVLRGEGDGRALRRFVQDRTAAAVQVFSARAGELGVTPRLPTDLVARAWVGEMVQVLTWWLEEEMPQTPEAVTDELLNLSLRGRYWASGFDGQPALLA